ncbi:site-2 protease family protein [Salipaludibacillus aurantiacus]|uniref:Peptidase M50 domain-containing protein n=1 Tax=Salipaludibacillus aurantiacus TaxID=1601833 RepID=A0A1H9SHU5_9BACI|nr:site-2 protease family protein [Salipaludibacillus aurantiacus]SER84542.1 hypothetical protein SAMN05518684_104230 [Salipaludibacillus aurantiacus]
MFGWSDIPTFVISLGIILPIVAFIHESGHFVSTYLFGGKMKFVFGRGKLLFKRGDFEIRRVYFLDAWTQLEKLDINNRWTHAIIYLSGAFFNILSVVIVNTLIHLDILPADLFFYQFGYFSLYFVFFSLLPVEFGEGQPSDGKAFIDVIRYGTEKGPIK